MKKIFKLIIALILIVSIKNVSASEFEITYSEWSIMYPSGLDSLFIESKDMYKWYKFDDNNRVVYVDEYYENLDGYTKDEGSHVKYYRYITNKYLPLDGKNNIVTDSDYCKKNFCYLLVATTPTMIDPTDKTESGYSTTDIVEYTPTVAPFTGDLIIYSIIGFILSISTITFIIIKKKKKQYE